MLPKAVAGQPMSCRGSSGSHTDGNHGYNIPNRLALVRAR